MAEEKKSIFRQKSIDRISSPEQLDQYLQVTRPSTWIILSAVIILLAGFISWGFIGRLDTKIDVNVVVEQKQCTVYVPEQYDSVDGKEIEIGHETYTLEDIGLVGIEGYKAYKINTKLEDGMYVGKILVEQVKPISFIFN
ncbi:MAG: hypothetical protein HUJ53_08315 [Holdemanella sp.]|nr:hypothetical protein [Holdemanella sp.]